MHHRTDATPPVGSPEVTCHRRRLWETAGVSALKLLRMLGLAIVLGIAIQVVLLAPVEGDPDRGMLPPVDQHLPAGAR